MLPSTLLNLPDTFIAEVLANLDCHSYVAAISTCKKIHEISVNHPGKQPWRYFSDLDLKMIFVKDGESFEIDERLTVIFSFTNNPRYFSVYEMRDHLPQKKNEVQFSSRTKSCD